MLIDMRCRVSLPSFPGTRFPTAPSTLSCCPQSTTCSPARANSGQALLRAVLPARCSPRSSLAHHANRHARLQAAPACDPTTLPSLPPSAVAGARPGARGPLPDALGGGQYAPPHVSAQLPCMPPACTCCWQAVRAGRWCRHSSTQHSVHNAQHAAPAAPPALPTCPLHRPATCCAHAGTWSTLISQTALWETTCGEEDGQALQLAVGGMGTLHFCSSQCVCACRPGLLRLCFAEQGGS